MNFVFFCDQEDNFGLTHTAAVILAFNARSFFWFLVIVKQLCDHPKFSSDTNFAD